MKKNAWYDTPKTNGLDSLQMAACIREGCQGGEHYIEIGTVPAAIEHPPAMDEPGSIVVRYTLRKREPKGWELVEHAERFTDYDLRWDMTGGRVVYATNYPGLWVAFLRYYGIVAHHPFMAGWREDNEKERRAYEQKAGPVRV